MSTPTHIHQLITLEIYDVIKAYIKKKKGKCIVHAAPMDVQLDCDNRTMVQPDIQVICDRDKLRKRSVYGAPDFVVEVMSPSTRKKDVNIKLRKYEQAGVREYWIVDPDKKRVHVYEFEKEGAPIRYSFDNKIPVGIFGEECIVNFAEIYDYVKFQDIS